MVESGRPRLTPLQWAVGAVLIMVPLATGALGIYGFLVGDAGLLLIALLCVLGVSMALPRALQGLTGRPAGPRDARSKLVDVAVGFAAGAVAAGIFIEGTVSVVLQWALLIAALGIFATVIYRDLGAEFGWPRRRTGAEQR